MINRKVFSYKDHVCICIKVGNIVGIKKKIDDN
jgi:hypothetical protein